MRILHLGKFYPPFQGGMEVFLRDLAEEQAAQGHEVRVLVHASQQKPETPAPGHGPRVERAACLPGVHRLGALVHTPVSAAYPLLLRRLLKRWRPQVLHAHVPNPGAFWPLLRLLQGGAAVPLVLHWHADVAAASGDPRLQRLYPFYRPLERRLLQRAAAVVVSSPQALEASDALHPFRDKCSVIPLGRRDPTAGVPLPAETADGRPLILSVGRFARYKRFHALVQAMRHLPAELDAHCVIAGEGPLLPQVRREVQRLELEGRVALPGRVDDATLHDYYRAASLFCLPSAERTEAFGLVLLEAMAFARPLVTAPLPGSGVEWLNRHEQTGLRADGPEPQSLAAAMARLLQDAPLRNRLGRQGRSFYETHCSIATVSRAVERVYDAVLIQSSPLRRGGHE